MCSREKLLELGQESLGAWMSVHIELERTFSPIQPGDEYDPDVWRALRQFGGDSTGWDAVLDWNRVVILAEAGVGKTHELREMAARLRRDGKSAFFCRIEDIGAEQLGEALEVGQDSLDTWMEGNETGWFFLDSVDEARLADRRYFERALRKLSKALGDNAHRARVYISSRASDWRPATDLEIVTRYLSPPAPSKEIADDDKGQDQDSPLDSLEEDKRDRSDNEVHIVRLEPLDEDQIRRFAQGQGVNDADAFLEAIIRSEATIFAERPQDLIELVAYWREYGRIGSHAEMLVFNITTKLKETNPDRDSLSPLAPNKARAGVEMLAAALTFMRSSAVALPDSGPRQEDMLNCTQADGVLPSWTAPERQALLTRAIFDQATYGRARFHHRSVREYLTAEWLVRLLEQGKSRRAVEELIFASRHGLKVVPPSLEPIAAWLALCDHGIRERLINEAPQVLIAHGDPSQLPIDVRRRLLIQFAELNRDRDDTGLSVDIKKLARLADPALAPTVRELLVRHRSQEDMRELMLRLIWQGQLGDCSDLALDIALDASMDDYSRQCGVRAVGAAGTNDQKRQVAETILQDPTAWDHQPLGDALLMLFPSALSVPELVSVVQYVKPPGEFSLDNIDHAMSTIAQSSCPDDQCQTLMHGLLPLIEQQPHIADYAPASSRYVWLLPYVAKLAERLLAMSASNDRQSLEIELRATELVGKLGRHLRGHSYRTKNHLPKIVQSDASLRLKLFWRAAERIRKEQSDKEQRTECWQILHEMPFEQQLNDDDFEVFLQQINLKESMDDRLIALGTAFGIRRSGPDKRKRLYRLKKAVKDIPELEERLDELLHPGPMSDVARKFRRQERKWKRRQRARKQAEEEQRHRRIEALQRAPQRLRNITDRTVKAVFGDLYDLSQQVRYAVESRHRWGCAEWQQLIPEFGREVAEAARDGFKAYWGLYTPETEAQNGSCTHGVVVGLTGLAVEAAEDPDWANKLSSIEAKTAITYAVHEINGLPDWAPDLIAVHPATCDEVIREELRWEINFKGDQPPHHMFSAIRYGEGAVRSRYLAYVFTLIQETEPRHAQTLENTLYLLLRWENLDTSAFAALAKKRFGLAEDDGRRLTWFVAWLCVDAGSAFATLREWIENAANDQEAVQRTISFCGALMPHREMRFRSIHRDFERIEILRELVPFIYRHVRIDEDHKHEGVFEPDARDNAESTRSYLLGRVMEMSGPEAFNALMHFSQCLPHPRSRDRMITLVHRRAAVDAEPTPWEATDLISFSREAEKAPRSQRELFEISYSRLDDLKLDLEDGDESEAAIIINIDQETTLRMWFAKRLRGASRGRYTVAQEDELADATRPDLRVHSPNVEAPVPIELKIADNWTYGELSAGLVRQLAGQYQRDERTKFGIYLLVWRGEERKRRKRPSDGRLVDFGTLVVELQAEAEQIPRTRQDIEEIRVVGIDLTKRAKRT